MTSLAKPSRKSRSEDLQQQLRDLREDIADLEARADGHLDQGRAEDALELLQRAANLQQHAREIQGDVVQLGRSSRGLPNRTSSWAVDR